MPDHFDDSLRAWLVSAFSVALELVGIEVHRPKVARRVQLGLIVEMPGTQLTAFPAGGHRARSHAIAKLDDGDEAVAGGAVDLLRSLVGPRAERRERAPAR